MAIFTQSANISEIRGDVGNVSYSRNKYGPFVRAKIVQVNPNTSFQQTRRAAMQAANTAWKLLTDSEFRQWQNYVDSHKAPGRLPGRTRRTAWNEFASRYMNRGLLGSAATGFSPLPGVRKHPWITAVNIATDTLAVSLNSLEATGFVSVAVYASRPMSPGIRSFNESEISYISNADVATLDHTFDIYDEYIARYPLVGDFNGQKIFVAVKAINNDNFAESIKSFSSGIIAGWPEFFDTFDTTFDETFS